MGVAAAALALLGLAIGKLMMGLHFAEDFPFPENFLAVLGFFDLLWGFLALSTAFEIAAGGGSGD